MFVPIVPSRELAIHREQAPRSSSISRRASNASRRTSTGWTSCRSVPDAANSRLAAPALVVVTGGLMAADLADRDGERRKLPVQVVDCSGELAKALELVPRDPDLCAGVHASGFACGLLLPALCAGGRAAHDRRPVDGSRVLADRVARPRRLSIHSRIAARATASTSIGSDLQATAHPSSGRCPRSRVPCLARPWPRM